MIGLVQALGSGFSFSLNGIFVRKGMYRSGESFSPLPISLFLGMILFGLSLSISGEAEQLASLSWLGVSSLVGAGVIHFLVGRMLGYISIRLIGANRAMPIQTSYILLAALLGIFFLGESLTISLVLSLLLVVGGITLISTKDSSKAEKSGMPEGSLTRGVFAALGAALCWSVSPVLVKIGLNEVGSPLVATFISYTAASMVVGVLLFHPRNNEKLRRLDRTSLIPFIIAGTAGSMAQILRYSALSYSRVSLIVPLIATRSLFVFPLSFLINREIEAFNLRIIMGAIAIVGGVLLIFWSA